MKRSENASESQVLIICVVWREVGCEMERTCSDGAMVMNSAAKVMDLLFEWFFKEAICTGIRTFGLS